MCNGRCQLRYYHSGNIDSMDELNDYLGHLDLTEFRRGNRNEGTKFLTAKVIEFSRRFGFSYQTEISLGLKRPTSDYWGYLDFVLEKGNERFAIEIDSSNKKWSLQKLLHAHGLGYKAIWIRWCVPMRINVPNDVYLIDLTSAA